MKTDAPTCDFCEGSLFPRVVTVDWRSKGRLVVIEGVPALVCDQCGERCFSARVMGAMERIARRKDTVPRTIRVPIRKFEGVA